MSVTHPLPDKELQWRRSPHLPSQELRTVKSKSKKSKNQWKKRQEKMPLAHAEVGSHPPLPPSDHPFSTTWFIERTNHNNIEWDV
jgi:hypothetical protein